MYRTFATTLACIANNTGIYYLKIREKQAATSFRYLTELEFVSPYIGLDPAACDPATIPPQPIPSFPVATGVAIRTSSQAIYLEWHDRQPFFGSISPSQWHIRTDVETSTFVQIGAGDFGMERYSLGLSFSVSHSTRARLRISDVAFAQPTIHASIESSEFAYPSGTSQSFELPRVGGIIFRTCGRLHRREVQVYGWCIVHRPSLVEPLFAWWDSLTFTVRFILPGYVLSHNEATAKLGVMCGHVDQLNDKLPVLTLPSGFTRRCLKYTIADRLPLVFRVPAFSACACRYSGFAGRLTSRISPYRSSCEPDTKIPHELIVRTAAEEALNSYGPAIGFPSSESFFHFSLTTYQDLKTEDIMRIEVSGVWEVTFESAYDAYTLLPWTINPTAITYTDRGADFLEAWPLPDTPPVALFIEESSRYQIIGVNTKEQGCHLCFQSSDMYGQGQTIAHSPCRCSFSITACASYADYPQDRLNQ
ncbi:unnamed protein product [Peniophora sp. CBMAI 1063]|nr:unnamed protein product [Peniophora sp. CBMAI 1063]